MCRMLIDRNLANRFQEIANLAADCVYKGFTSEDEPYFKEHCPKSCSKSFSCKMTFMKQDAT